MNNKLIRAGKFPSPNPLHQSDAGTKAKPSGSYLGLFLALLGSAMLASLCLNASAPSALPLVTLLLESTTAMAGPFVLPLVMDANGGTLGMLLLGLIGTACAGYMWRRSALYSRSRSVLACLCWSGAGAVLMQPIFS